MIASIKIVSDNRIDIRYEDVLCKAYGHDFFIKLTSKTYDELIDLIILNLSKIEIRLPNISDDNLEFENDANRLKVQIFDAMYQLSTKRKIDFDGKSDVKLLIKKEMN